MKHIKKTLFLLLMLALLCGCEERHPSKYFTVPETGQAEWILTHEQNTPDASRAEEASDDAHITEIREMARQLYPELKRPQVSCSGTVTAGTYTLTCYEVCSKDGSLVCTIAVDPETQIYYLYNTDNATYIPIEFDRNGVRLVS